MRSSWWFLHRAAYELPPDKKEAVTPVSNIGDVVRTDTIASRKDAQRLAREPDSGGVRKRKARMRKLKTTSATLFVPHVRQILQLRTKK